MRAFLDPPLESLTRTSWGSLCRTGLVAAGGFALYGFTIGFWRSPEMAGYVAIKMPLLIACTLGCNGLLNGLLGLLLGSGLGFRSSLQALLNAFAISGLVLGSASPVTFFLALNTPPPGSPDAQTAHSAHLLIHTILIAVAGCLGVLRLGRLLGQHCPTPTIARSTLLAWLTGNALLGAQFAWILRPFFGNPQLPVAFLRPNPMRGSFYEVLFDAFVRTVSSLTPAWGGLSGAAAAILLLSLLATKRLRIPIQQP